MTGALAWLPDEWDATDHHCPRLGSLPCRREDPHLVGHLYVAAEAPDGKHDDEGEK